MRFFPPLPRCKLPALTALASHNVLCSAAQIPLAELRGGGRRGQRFPCPGGVLQPGDAPSPQRGRPGKAARALPGGRPAPFSPPGGGAGATRGELRSSSGTEGPEEGSEGRTHGRTEGAPSGRGCPQKGLATAARREARARLPPNTHAHPPFPHSATPPAPRPRPARPGPPHASSPTGLGTVLT